MRSPIIVHRRFDPKVVNILRKGGIAILRTDTLYGVVASALNQSAVERVYRAKHRTPAKPPIVLIASIDQMFNAPSIDTKTILDTYWPGPYSVIVPDSTAPNWLTRGTGTVAYRMPDDTDLRHLLQATGPLIAPSANPEGAVPAANVEKAIDYFGNDIDIYVDSGEVSGTAPSQLLRLTEDGVERLR